MTPRDPDPVARTVRQVRQLVWLTAVALGLMLLTLWKVW